LTIINNMPEHEKSMGSQIEGEEPKKYIEIEVLLMRHGKQDHKAEGTVENPLDRPLSEEGREQARQFAHDFITTHQDEKIAIKVEFSPLRRARETAEEIIREIEIIIKQRNLANIAILRPHSKEALNTAGIGQPLIEAGIPFDKMVEEWMANAPKYQATHPEMPLPVEISGRVEDMVGSADRIAKRLQTITDEGKIKDPRIQGAKIVYLLVTHDPAHGAFLQKRTGKMLADLGGGVKPTEFITIHTSGEPGSSPKIIFRGREIPTPAIPPENAL
jgi:hypothetical protein